MAALSEARAAAKKAREAKKAEDTADMSAFKKRT